MPFQAIRPCQNENGAVKSIPSIDPSIDSTSLGAPQADTVANHCDRSRGPTPFPQKKKKRNDEPMQFDGSCKFLLVFFSPHYTRDDSKSPENKVSAVDISFGRVCTTACSKLDLYVTPIFLYRAILALMDAVDQNNALGDRMTPCISLHISSRSRLIET